MSSINIDNSTKSGGVGFFGLLTILFIGLKLMGYIDWSWWWVLSPIWIPITVIVALYIVVWLFAVIVTMSSASEQKKRR